jgi:predicted RNA binding protein YcfA (HicA-like mRNA interferase family)
MPKIRTLSGDDLLRIFAQFGFTKHSQRGSHINCGELLPQAETARR